MYGSKFIKKIFYVFYKEGYESHIMVTQIIKNYLFYWYIKPIKYIKRKVLIQHQIVWIFMVILITRINKHSYHYLE